LGWLGEEAEGFEEVWEGAESVGAVVEGGELVVPLAKTGLPFVDGAATRVDFEERVSSEPDLNASSDSFTGLTPALANANSKLSAESAPVGLVRVVGLADTRSAELAFKLVVEPGGGY
jgi:hypothetical protein